ncbi:CHAT domain-containing protein [Limobrevibacterium gyesilva]|uniref:CHAT domain-containing protein n=1 Tax=Limobrevibacterium gyesilva TaxID=2991712 RepID=A0AA42CGI7_9PROT|nr:CHAT domain-containing protein [Limobrevibacterium gyesilva]MCW3473885.1 CHAT domain-containing protein [Limobrevibacterium gyesilva]
MRLHLSGALAFLFALAGCTPPPPSAYVGGGTAQSVAQVSIGNNSVGEACTQQADASQGADIFCGTWVQPSARVRAGGAASAATLRQLATTSPWRTALDLRFACGDAAATTILGGEQALVMQCTRRVGGWPHVAMVALVGGNAWYADGVLPVLPAMERSIGVLSGRMKADAVPPTSAADALLADRLAAKAFGSSDIGLYEQLIEAGTRANLADDPVRAEGAYRQALAVQEKALGRDNPNTATPITFLALQLSNQGRYSEADLLFSRAQPLVVAAADPVAAARLLHYRGLHALNQGHYAEALALLTQAETSYARVVPPESLRARPSTGGSRFARAGTAALADLMPNQQLLTDPAARSALFGLVEVRRYRSVALRLLGRDAESDDALRSANDLARANGLSQPLLTARLFRTGAMTAASQGRPDAAVDELARSTQAFSRALPDSKPLANTQLLRARLLAHTGDDTAALAQCRAGVQLLTTLKSGTDPDLIAGCLDVYAAAAAQAKEGGQALLAEMFAASQVAQGGITSQQIAQATARLGENARDPRVAQAIRTRQDASATLADLFRQKDDLLQGQTSGSNAKAPDTTEIDKKIADAQVALADADAALQAASPNYGQLVQQAVPASAVQAALRPDEAFAAMTLTADGGWVFMVRSDRLAVARIDGGLPRMAQLVKRIRASIENENGEPPRFDTRAAHELYVATLGGVAGALEGATSLTVAPAGPLLSLPFEVLLTADASSDDLTRAPWLLRKYTLAHVPSASNFVSLRKVAAGSRGTRTWFGFGDFRPVTLAQAQRSFQGQACGDSARLFATLPPLPFARRELEAARLLLGAAPSDELLGNDFTAKAVQKAQLKNYRVLQFATHALLPAELRCQAEPAIVTSAPDGAPDASGALLTASQVAGLDLDADLVILSACNSGGPGGTTAGESLSGLARSFFYAGARALMVTHWAVNDQTAAYLVADTLRRLRENPAMGIAAALRDAQLGMLDDAGHGLNAAVAHPFYWAPFALIGEGGRRAGGAAS